MTDDLRHTPLRHRLLAEVGIGEVALLCKNIKRAIWRPWWHHPRLGIPNEMTAAESRAAGEIVWTYGCTPYWQGDMDVIRTVELNDLGRELLASWNEQHGDPSEAS